MCRSRIVAYFHCRNMLFCILLFCNLQNNWHSAEYSYSADCKHLGFGRSLVEQLRQIATLKRKLRWETGLLNTSQVTFQKDLLVCENDHSIGTHVSGDVVDLCPLLDQGRFQVLQVFPFCCDKIKFLAGLGVHQLGLCRLWSHQFGIRKCLNKVFFQLGT